MKPLLFFLLLLLSTGPALAKVNRQWCEDHTCDYDSLAWSIPTGATAVTIEACVAMEGLKDSRGVDRFSWELSLVLADSTVHTLTVGWGNTDYGDFSDQRYLEVKGLEEPVRLTNGVDMYSGDNTMIVETDEKGVANVYIGNDVMKYIGSIELNTKLRRVKLASHGKLHLEVMAIESEIPENLDSGFGVDELAEVCRPGQTAPLGLWHYLDRDNDVTYARPGGTYSLVIVPDKQNVGHFIILYAEGAVVNAHSWKPGMIKGRLLPTMFSGRYRLEWWDANKERVADEANAVVENNILTLNFPLLHSQLRYSR